MKFFCHACDYLKDPEMLESISYFELFGVEQKFDIDTQELDKTFYKLQNLFHPDRFTAKDDDGLVKSSNTYSSYINNGYRLLKDDFERAKYLLEMKGYEVLAEHHQLNDTKLLMKIMEIREQIEFANTPQELTIYKSLAEDERDQLFKKVARLFHKEEYDKIKDLLVELKYHNRILEAIGEREEDFM